MSETPDDREALAATLNEHHVTRGMQVASGVTCECRYWTGNEPEEGKRPLPWGSDRLDLHRADAILDSDWLADRDARMVTEGVKEAARALGDQAVIRMDKYGPLDSYGAAIWDCARWLDENFIYRADAVKADS